MTSRHTDCRCLEFAAKAGQTRRPAPKKKKPAPLSRTFLTAEGRRVLFDSTVSHTELYVRNLMRFPVLQLLPGTRKKGTTLHKAGNVCLHL